MPTWINRLATICVRFPFLAACIPKEWLRPEGLGSLVDLNEWEEIDVPPPSNGDGEDSHRSPGKYICSSLCLYPPFSHKNSIISLKSDWLGRKNPSNPPKKVETRFEPIRLQEMCAEIIRQ